MAETEQGITLRTITGPAAADRDVPVGRRITIGRSVSCDICLLDATVSREHAALTWNEDRGILVDLKSSRGTLLNGIRLEPQAPTPVAAGDLLTIGPWTFRLHRPGEQSAGLHTIDDLGSAAVNVERLPSTMSSDAQDGRLQFLIDYIANLNGASDEPSLARAAVAAALKGTGFRRAAMLRSDASDNVEVLASLRRDVRSEDNFVFSRSLVREATRGHVVTMTSPDVALDGRSIADLGIQSAMCLPVHLGSAVAAVLYLDSRRGERASDAANTSYCEAVARACGLAMANLKRADLERRQAQLHQELAAAREVQRVLVPPESGRLGPIDYAVRMRPGLFVAGDLFDVFPLPGGQAGVCIGDVSGHGLGPALVMAMAQSHLHAQLTMHADPSRAVEQLNRYVADHVSDGRYVSLWLGVIGPDGLVRYVDAGHGHWRLISSDGRVIRGDRSDQSGGRGDIPVGINAEHQFECEQFRLAPGDRLLLYSDGITEQRGPSGEEFGIGRLVAAAAAAAARSAEQVAAIAAALDAYMGGRAPSDDATIACIMGQDSSAESSAG